MLFLGMTTPKKEIFLGTYGDAARRLRCCTASAAPSTCWPASPAARRVAWQRCGMEWAYRVAAGATPAVAALPRHQHSPSSAWSASSWCTRTARTPRAGLGHPTLTTTRSEATTKGRMHERDLQRPRRRSSASATSACRPRSPWRPEASTSSASTSTRRPSKAVANGEVPFVEPDLAVGRERRGRHGPPDRHDRDAGGRRLHHRGADAVQGRPHGRPELRPRGDRADRAEAARWRDRHPRVDLAARDHRERQRAGWPSCDPT